MKIRPAMLAMAAVWVAAPAIADDGPPPHRPRHVAPAHPAAVPGHRAGPGEAATVPLFPETGAGESAADRSAALERRRKAFFAAPAETSPAPEPGAPPVDVTLGGSGGLTPAMGLKF